MGWKVHRLAMMQWSNLTTFQSPELSYQVWIYLELEGNNALGIRKGWILCMPSFIAVAQLLLLPGGVLTPNFGRYVPWQREKLARAPERAPGRAWKWGSPERAWAVLSLKMGGSGTSLIRFSVKMGLSGTARTRLANPRRWKWDSPELPGRVWLTRGAAYGLSRPWEAMNGLKLKKFWNDGLRHGKIRQKL